MSVPRPHCPADSAGADPDAYAGAGELVRDLLSRCTFPDPGSALVCGVSGGADSLSLLVLAVAAGCRVTAVHVDHGLRPGSAREAEVVARAARTVRGLVPGRAGGGGRRAQPRGPGPGGRAWPPWARAPPPVTPPTTRPRRCWPTCCAAPGCDGLAGHAGRPRPPPAGPPAVRDRGALRPAGPDPGARPVQRRPPLRPQPRPPRAGAPVLARSPAGTWCRSWPVRPPCSAGTPTSSRRWPRWWTPHDAAALAAAPTAVGRRSVREWLTGDGPYPPPLDAVDRVLEVARRQRRATQIPGGRTVRRSAGRLSVTPAHRPPDTDPLHGRPGRSGTVGPVMADRAQVPGPPDRPESPPSRTGPRWAG